MLTKLKEVWGDLTSRSMPPKSWVDNHSPSDFTGDIALLERSEFQLTFIYDQMMSNHRMHGLLKDHAEMRGSAFTVRSNFVLYKKKLGLGTYPIPLRVQAPIKNLARTPLNARIKGELYKVRSTRFLDLDEYKANGIEFRRQRVQLFVPYRWQRGNQGVDDEEFLTQVWAWMYVGKKTYWDEHLDGGYQFGRCEMFELNNKYSDGVFLDRYYTFTPKELSD